MTISRIIKNLFKALLYRKLSSFMLYQLFLEVMNNIPLIIVEGTNEGRGWEKIK
jgi:hypothetical protein